MLHVYGIQVFSGTRNLPGKFYSANLKPVVPNTELKTRDHSTWMSSRETALLAHSVHAVFGLVSGTLFRISILFF